MKQIITLFVLLFSLAGLAQHVNWISIEEAYAKTKTDPKPIIVDVYTDWCGWCKKMDKDTYEKANIYNYINENFYAVKFDAEQKDSLHILDHTFKFVPSGRRGYHELAAALLEGRLSYPATVFLSGNFEKITVVPGYQSADNFHPILAYVQGEHYKTTPWEEYLASYKENK
ncbi:MAG: DUF255 domain-containing protein [Schleiferiaceae bacterium]|jgi:thioredoxin-related protein|nr:DUF255 domain-containing protein [Schleiferiaceae bacterium]